MGDREEESRVFGERKWVGVLRERERERVVEKLGCVGAEGRAENEGRREFCFG